MRMALTLILTLAASTALGDSTVKYSILFQGGKHGQQTITTKANGRTIIDYSYRDNGRGPDLHEELTLAPDGTLSDYKSSGKATFGAPISEKFALKGTHAEWQSTADRGTAEVSGAAQYVPLLYSDAVTGYIARAIARQPAMRLAALPGGELKVQKLGTANVSAGGQKKTLALYAITGINTQPDFVWLDTDEPQVPFAVTGQFRRVIVAGWETQADVLRDLQVKMQGEYLQALARRLTHHLPEPIVIRNVRIFDSKEARLLPAADVYVRHGRITAIYEPNSSARDAGTEIDGSGQVLMPALFDMHSHEDVWNVILQIAGGVTTSRDMANDNAALARIIDEIGDERLLGPRIIPCGFLEGESPYSSRGGFVVNDLQAAKDAVDWYAQRGFRQIKIYSSFHPEWVAPTAAYAHQRGLRVSGHIPAFMRAEEAVRAGYDEIQHINQVALNFFQGPKDDTRTLARFTLIGDHAYTLDLNSQPVQDFVALLKEHHTDLDLTLAAFEGMFNQAQGEVDPAFAAVADHVPVALQRQLRTNSMNTTAANLGHYRASYARLLEFAKLLYDSGVPLIAGTDNIAGFTLHRELELYVKLGIPAPQALHIATWNGARYTGTLDRLGSIEAGKSADLLLLAGDPTTNISDIRKGSLVMKEGVAYLPAEVYEAVGVKRFADPPGIKQVAR